MKTITYNVSSNVFNPSTNPDSYTENTEVTLTFDGIDGRSIMDDLVHVYYAVDGTFEEITQFCELNYSPSSDTTGNKLTLVIPSDTAIENLRIDVDASVWNPTFVYRLTGCTFTKLGTWLYGCAGDFLIIANSGYTYENIRISARYDGVLTNLIINPRATPKECTATNLRGSEITIYANAQPVRTLLIKSADGSRDLFTYTFNKNIKTIVLTTSGINRTLTIDGEVLNYFGDSVTDEEFKGYGKSVQNPEISVPINQFVSADYTDITFIEKFEPETPTVEDFKLTLYKNSAEPNRVNKFDYLTYVGELTGTLRESCSIVNPMITIEYNGVPDFNYVYVN